MSAESKLFSDDDLPELRALIEQRLVELRAVAESFRQATETVELDQARVGRLSRMDAMQGQAMSRESERRREQQVGRLEQALQRMQDGDYGHCVRCDEPIALGRLRFDPGALVCVACAERG